MRSKRFVGVAIVLMMMLAAFAAVPAGADDEEVTVAVLFNRDIDEGVVTDLGGVVVLKIPYIDAVTAKVDKSDIAKLRKDSAVQLVEMDCTASITKPNKKPGDNTPTYYLPPTGEVMWGVERTEADHVWTQSGYSAPSSVTIAVLDTGVKMDHPDFEDVTFVSGYDYINDDNDPSDDNGHGTHCAGIIAADYGNLMKIGDDQKETYGVVGMAYGVNIMPVKVLDNRGSGSYVAIAAGIVFAADSGADVISMSLGGSSDSSVMHDAIRYAISKGVIVVASAGNSGKRNVNLDTIGYPAKYPEVIAVGAIDEYDYRASFSSTGSSLDIMAPGVAIWSTYKDGQWRSMSGTSMACPHVAGAVALILENTDDPNSDDVWTPAEMHSWLKQTAENDGSGWNSAFGYGILNAMDSVYPS